MFAQDDSAVERTSAAEAGFPFFTRYAALKRRSSTEREA
jgi:hypothetical protein